MTAPSFSAETDSLPLASPLARCLARLLDGFLVAIVLFMVGAALGIFLLIGNVVSALLLASIGLADLMTPAISSLVWSGFQALNGIGALLYYAVLESSLWQATLGKRFLDVQVTDTFGTRISFWRALVRNLLLLASVAFIIPLFVSIAMLWLHPRRQTLHDIATGTQVIRKPIEGTPA